MSDLIARLKLTADGREFIQVLEQAGVKLNDLDGKAKQASGGAKALDAASASTSASLQNMADRTGPLGAGLAALGPAGLAAAAAIGALTLGLKASLSAAAEAEKLELRLGAVLKATGNAAGFTQKQLQDFAGELQGSLKINDEKITESIAVLATFRAVSGDTFKQTIGLAADMAAVFGGDLTSSTLQLGKALQDPTQGMSALARVGVTFSDQQKEMIGTLQESGDLLGAQGVIIGEVTKQIGGAAQAEAGGLTGATRGLDNAWDNLLETLGKTSAIGGTIKSALGGLTGFIETITNQIAGPTLNQDIENLKAQIASLSKFDPDISRQASRAAALKERQEELEALQDSIALTEQLNQKTADGAKAAAAGAALKTKWNKDLEDMLADAGAANVARAKDEKGAADAAKKHSHEKAAALKEEKDLIFSISGLLDADLKKQAARKALYPDYLDGLEQELRLGGMTAAARAEEVAVLEIRNRLEKEGLALSEGQEKQIRQNVAAITAQKELAAAAEKFWQDLKNTAEGIADDVAGFLVDGIVNAAEGGKSTFDDMWDAAMAGGKRFLANIAAEILKQKFILPITTSIVSAVPGLFGIQGGAGGGNGGGGSGALGTAGNAASLLGAATGPGAMLSNGVVNFGLSTGAYGVGTGLSIASAIPYIGAGVAALGILKSLGVIGGGKSVGPNAGGQLSEIGGVFSVGPTGADNGGNVAGVTAELSQAAQVLNALAMGIGVAQIGDGLASYIDTFKAGGIGNAADLIKDAISKGVIEGLTEAEASLIASSGNLGATAEAIISARAENLAFPAQIAAQRQQLENPRQFAIDALNIETEGLRARARALSDGTQTLLDIDVIYQKKLRDIETQFASGAGAAIGSALDAALTAQGIALGRVDAAFKVLSQSVQTERNSLTVSFNAGLKTSQDALKGVSGEVARLSGISNVLKSALGGMEGPGDPGASRRAAQRQISDALFAVRNGGALPDEESLRGALSVLQKPSEGLFETFTDYSRDFQITQNDISDLSNYAGWQVVKAENQAQILQRQIDQDRMAYDAEIARLDDVVSTAEAQISAVNGTTLAVMSVQDAVRELAAALAGAGVAKTALNAANPAPGLYQAFLKRAPDKAGEAFYNNEIASGRATSRDVAISIASSPEFAAANPTLTDLYGTILGRAPDAPGLAYWQTALNAGMSISDIAANFVRDKEYSDLAAVRGFAKGGTTLAGETFLAGEGGQPELITSAVPLRVYNGSQTSAMLDNSGVVAKLDQVVRILAALERQMQDTSRSSARTAALLHSVTQDGESLMTRAAA